MHGFGLKNISSALSKCNGDYELGCNGKNFNLQLSFGSRSLHLCNKAFIYVIQIAFSLLMAYKRKY